VPKPVRVKEAEPAHSLSWVSRWRGLTWSCPASPACSRPGAGRCSWWPWSGPELVLW